MVRSTSTTKSMEPTEQPQMHKREGDRRAVVEAERREANPNTLVRSTTALFPQQEEKGPAEQLPRYSSEIFQGAGRHRRWRRDPTAARDGAEDGSRRWRQGKGRRERKIFILLLLTCKSVTSTANPRRSSPAASTTTMRTATQGEEKDITETNTRHRKLS